ncbi:cryptochrome DASH-like isoform X2 [Trachinotus anak]|uniref:cryptochrome DASH-like isoform X2 n=1 Tax=Trachinotus anak TaxID=443729 RepID=UPI0039F1C970
MRMPGGIARVWRRRLNPLFRFLRWTAASLAPLRRMVSSWIMPTKLNVASSFTKDLGLDWRVRAKQLEYFLIDHDVCSNYGNWLYSAGIGNDPRENRKFNMIKQGLDYDNNGDYVRQWVPELQRIRGADVHTPWTLSTAALSHANVSLGETYPTPIVIAPERSRHVNKKSGGKKKKRGRGKKGSAHTPKPHQDKGTDLYFSRGKNLLSAIKQNTWMMLRGWKFQ